MVTNKVKVNLNAGQRTQDNQNNKNAGERIFKIYTEEKAVNVDKTMVKAGTIFPKPKLSKKCSSMDLNYHAKADVKYVEKKDKSNGFLTKTMRMALADVSNIRSNSSAKKVLYDGSKPMKSKFDKRVSLQRVSMGRLNKIDVSSRNSFVKTEINSDERVSNSQSSEKVLVKGLKTSSDLRTKTHRPSNDFSCIVNKRTAKVPLISSRRSLPVLKRVNGENATTSKGIADSFDKIKERVRIPVGRKSIFDGSNAKGYHLRSRASNGFIMTGQANIKTQTVPGKSVNLTQQTSKTFMKARDAPRTSKLINAGTAKISLVKSLVSKTTLTLAPSLSKNTVDEASADKPCDLDPSASKNIAPKRKAGRRRSYTSMLLAGSKVIEYTSVIKQDKLPSIDNEHNQLEVAEYVEEIYQYYWVMEAESPSLENYLSEQMDIVPQLRGILINWLIEVHLKFDLMHETLFLSIVLLDKYLSQVVMKKDDLQLVGLTTLLLASKHEDFWHPRVIDLISISAEPYTREQMLQMEMLILKKLKFRLNHPTPYLFMIRFLKAAQSEAKLDHLAFYLIELCLVEYEALKFKPSLLCASAIYLARCTLKISPSWTPLLCKHTHYEVSHLSDCAEMILKFQKSAKQGRLKVTFEKYSKPDYSSVAAIKPIDALPSSLS